MTRLIIKDAHEELGYGSGVEQVLTLLRSRFWIVKGRRAVRSIVESCAQCRRGFSVKTAEQKMAPLPRPRLQSLRAFERVGVDYGGPFLTKQGRGKAKAKRYLCLFTCLATRAVHLEMSYSLDTASFINAFTPMVSPNCGYKSSTRNLDRYCYVFVTDPLIVRFRALRIILWLNTQGHLYMVRIFWSWET